MAVSGPDGAFTLWDPRYVGGTIQVAATLVGGDVTSLCPEPEGPNVACGHRLRGEPGGLGPRACASTRTSPR